MKNTLNNILHILCAGGIVGFLTFTSMVTIVHASPPTPVVGTPIEGTFDTDVTWTKSGSPYILTNDVFINGAGHTLTIEPGVTISLAPERLNMPTAIYITDAGVRVSGTEKDHVHIGGIDKIHIFNGTANVSYADMTTNGPGLLLYWSRATIATSTFSHSTGGGLFLWSSAVDMWDSQVTNNAINGIYVASDAAGRPHSSLTVRNSIIANNGQYAIRNGSSNVIYAENNWWGSVDGPMASSTYNTIKGIVMYSPWLTLEPDLGPKPPTCCSSILFLPGLEASRLYRPESLLMGTISTTNRLWEPNRNDDVRKLFLESNGSSIDPSIYAGEPIGNAFGLVGIYGSFMNFLDELSHQGTIAEWKSFGYDWRMPIAEVVAGRTRRATTSESLIETVENLARDSKTGKVTLIAHSNGGLVAKYLIKTLVGMGKENLIDSVISVAVPYLGTPQAILALLHGDGQSIASGLFLKQSVAKEFGTNMASAYSLLPSANYFAKVFGPTIAYASGTTSASMVSVDSVAAQDSFIASRANSALMTAAEILHNILDPFSWPVNIARWAIVGWGNKTAKGIVYPSTGNSATSTYTAALTSMGDGTVVAPSAAYNSGTTTAVDLLSVANTEGRSIDHSNILEASTTKAVLKNIITTNTNAPGVNAKTIEDRLVTIPGVTIGEPDYNKEATFLVVSTHSPVELQVYDSRGNHTGVAPLPAGTDEDIEEGLFTYVEKNIPGSSFETHGDENQPETYISLPDSSGQTYSVLIQGTGVGEFTYNVQRIRGSEVLSTTDYTGLPVTPLTMASSTVTSGVQSTTPLIIDVDGNGSVDIIAQSNTSLDPILFFESLKNTVIQLLGSGKRTDDIVKRINKIEDILKKNKTKKIDSSVNKFTQKLGSKKLASLSSSDKDAIVSAIEQFIAQFE